MCIRDSNQTDDETEGACCHQRADVSRVKSASHGILQRNYHGSINPVSYTHLDVYKRQLMDCASLVGGLIIWDHSITMNYLTFG